MGWPFEHWDNGVCYFHHDNWRSYLGGLEQEYPHNELHRRLIVTLAFPRERLEEVPVPKEERIWFGTLVGGHNIHCEERDFSVIFQPFPRWLDPHNPAEPSWVLILEDNHPQPTLGERVVLYSTGNHIKDGNVFCYFRDRYWRVVTIEGGHYGPHPATHAQKTRKRRRLYRSIDDE